MYKIEFTQYAKNVQYTKKFEIQYINLHVQSTMHFVLAHVM